MGRKEIIGEILQPLNKLLERGAPWVEIVSVGVRVSEGLKSPDAGNHTALPYEMLSRREREEGVNL